MNRNQFIEKWIDPELPNDARLLGDDLDSLIAAAVQAEREAQQPLIDALEEIQKTDSDGFVFHTPREIVGIARAAIRARSGQEERKE